MGAFLQTNNSSLARWWRRRGARHVSVDAPVVLGGCPRSGTTLLRVMLDSHPHLACGPETSLLTGGFLPHKLASRFDIAKQELWQLHREATDHAHFVELFFHRYAMGREKPRWGDKTPQNIRHLGWILEHFPRAKFLHVIRDGRDVVCSMRTHPRYRIDNGQKVATNIRRPIKPCIEEWLADTATGMKWRGHASYREVHYEDLVDSPETTLRTVCEFLDESFDPAMLAYHTDESPSRDATRFITNEAATQPLSRGALGRWQEDLTAEELGLFHQLAGPRLAELGYPVTEDRTGHAVGHSTPALAKPR